MMDCNGMMQGGMMGGMMLIGFLLLVGLAAVVALGVTWLVRRSGGVNPATEPLEVLKRRLAQGEITPEEFSAMKRQLQES